MKGFLLRIGLDKNPYDGAIGHFSPLFNDGSFDFLPIALEIEELRYGLPKYSEVIGIKGEPLSKYVRKANFLELPIHTDPGFPHFSKWTLPWYYDDWINGYDKKDKKFYKGKNFLRELEDGGYLFFYAGLEPIEFPSKFEEGLYLIAYMKVRRALFGDALKKAFSQEKKLYSLAGVRRFELGELEDQIDMGFTVFEGDPTGSKVLDKAILISDYALARNGKRYYTLSKEWAKLTGNRQKSIQRSTCRIEVDDPEQLVKTIDSSGIKQS